MATTTTFSPPSGAIDLTTLCHSLQRAHGNNIWWNDELDDEQRVSIGKAVVEGIENKQELARECFVRLMTSTHGAAANGFGKHYARLKTALEEEQGDLSTTACQCLGMLPRCLTLAKMEAGVDHALGWLLDRATKAMGVRNATQLFAILQGIVCVIDTRGKPMNANAKINIPMERIMTLIRSCVSMWTTTEDSIGEAYLQFPRYALYLLSELTRVLKRALLPWVMTACEMIELVWNNLDMVENELNNVLHHGSARDLEVLCIQAYETSATVGVVFGSCIATRMMKPVTHRFVHDAQLWLSKHANGDCDGMDDCATERRLRESALPAIRALLMSAGPHHDDTRTLLETEILTLAAGTLSTPTKTATRMEILGTLCDLVMTSSNGTLSPSSNTFLHRAAHVFRDVGLYGGDLEVVLMGRRGMMMCELKMHDDGGSAFVEMPQVVVVEPPLQITTNNVGVTKATITAAASTTTTSASASLTTSTTMATRSEKLPSSPKRVRHDSQSSSGNDSDIPAIV